MPRQKKEPGARKFEESKKGRVWWKPGEPHPMDRLDDELQDLQNQLPEELNALLLAARDTSQRIQALQQLEQEDDQGEAFTAADHLIHHTIIERFRSRKHSHHLLTIFAIQRRRRLLGRLKAIRAALDLANGLLSEDETLSEEFLTTWREKIEQSQSPETMQAYKEQLEKEIKENHALSKEDRRIKHLDEPLEPLVGSVEQSRQFLRDFAAKLPELRAGLAAGNGWIEIFYVPKRKYKQEFIDYAKAWERYEEDGTPILPEIQQALDPRAAALIRSHVPYPYPESLRELIYNIVDVGPYAKYRWREDKQVYTISLGLESDYPEYPFIPEGF